jgi:hypothetical protein
MLAPFFPRRTYHRVTVLFADVKGSMDLADQVNPEERACSNSVRSDAYLRRYISPS